MAIAGGLDFVATADFFIRLVIDIYFNQEVFGTFFITGRRVHYDCYIYIHDAIVLRLWLFNLADLHIQSTEDEYNDT